MEYSYLDMLRAELKQYEASKARAAEMLSDDEQYRKLVLAGWDHVIAKQQTAIRKEEDRNRQL